MTESVTLKISVTSQASQAAIIGHLESIVNDIVNFKYDSWRTKIYTGWEEEVPADLTIERIDVAKVRL